MCTCSIKSNWSEADNIHKEITYLFNSKTQCVQWRTISNLSNQQTSHSQSQYCSLTAGSVMVLLLHRTPSSVCMHKQFWADIILANIDRKTLLVNCMISLEVILGCYPENKQNKRHYSLIPRPYPAGWGLGMRLLPHCKRWKAGQGLETRLHATMCRRNKAMHDVESSQHYGSQFGTQHS